MGKMRDSKFKTWSNMKLQESLVHHAARERKICALVIEHIAEVISRRAFVEFGHASIKEYLVRDLKYSESSAQRRISAAFVLLQIPEIKEEIENGSLNLSQIVAANVAIRHEQKTNGPVSVEQKRELFVELAGKTVVETEKILDEKFESLPPVTREKHKHDDSVEVTVRMPKALYADFVRIKELNSHTIPNGNWVEILEKIANDYLKRHDPLRKKTVTAEKTMRSMEPHPTGRQESMAEDLKDGQELNPSPQNKSSKGSHGPTQIIFGETLENPTTEATQSKTNAVFSGHLSTVRKALRPNVRLFVFQRDRVCQHKNEDGSICGSAHRLEIDHIEPKFVGGSDDVENLRLLCRAHNQSRYHLGR